MPLDRYPHVVEACLVLGLKPQMHFGLVDVAKLSGLSYRTVARRCEDGKMPHSRFAGAGRDTRRVRVDDLEDMLAAARRDTTNHPSAVMAGA